MESNHNPRFRRPVYYPLYYGGKLISGLGGRNRTCTSSIQDSSTSTILHPDIEFVSSCVPHIATIFPCNKAGRVKIRHLGFVQMILQLYSDLPIGRGSNPLPSTVSVLRRNLNSVTLLADTYKTWCPLQESNPHTLITKQDLYH
jgi:hypothetical protein